VEKYVNNRKAQVLDITAQMKDIREAVSNELEFYSN